MAPEGSYDTFYSFYSNLTNLSACVQNPCMNSKVNIFRFSFSLFKMPPKIRLYAYNTLSVKQDSVSS